MSGSKILAAPSMLAADFGRLAEETRRMEQAGADWIHLDVMDGHFVPNLAIGPQACAALRPVTRLPLDVHLMVADPLAAAGSFLQAGADRITFHLEAVRDLGATVRAIREKGAKGIGVALRPRTGWEPLEPVLDDLDLVLVMTVEPGFGGQAFMPQMLPKIESLRKRYRGRIQVDGGINAETARRTRDAGADVMVAGTYLFKAKDPARAIASLKGKEEDVR